jgi:hypothetical protein
MEEAMSDVVQAAMGPPQTPFLRDFMVSPGFAGAAIVLSVIVLFLAVLYTSRRAERRLDRQLELQDIHQQEKRADGERESAIERCWDRLVWLINTAATEPSGISNREKVTLGLGPELTLAILKGLLSEAKELGDDTLTSAVTVYLSQYGSVLGQLGGTLPAKPVSNGHQEPAAEAIPPGPKPAEKSDAAAPVNPEKGHRR